MSSSERLQLVVLLLWLLNGRLLLETRAATSLTSKRRVEGRFALVD
jgi:hypothetical protein